MKDNTSGPVGGPNNSNLQFTSVAAGESSTCAIEKGTDLLKCWGLSLPSKLSSIKFSSVAMHASHVCGVEKSTNIPVCFGDNRYNQENVPVTTTKWTIDQSCQTSHDVLSGPASCTSCDASGCNPHFTIIDPKTNTGTCTGVKCPTCKPKACCGEGHKHYVLNNQNLEGVCTRFSDDCTPVCIPLGSDDPKVRRVCSKGCNRLLKVLKNKNAETEKDMYEMVTCQAEKQVNNIPRVNYPEDRIPKPNHDALGHL